MSTLTIVSGFWITNGKHTIESYNNWFKTSLLINCPYVFFAPKDIIEHIKFFRKDLPTHYIELNIEDFYTYKFKDTIKTHPYHVPSKELNMIWNEKSFLIERAADINPFNTDFFAWIDATVPNYRNSAPPTSIFPRPNSLDNLPHDEFIFTSSDSDSFNPNGTEYYHYISGCFIIHKSFIKQWIDIFRKYIDDNLSKDTWIYTDQVIYTLIYKDQPEIFYKFGHGYGRIVELLR